MVQTIPPLLNEVVSTWEGDGKIAWIGYRWPREWPYIAWWAEAVAFDDLEKAEEWLRKNGYLMTQSMKT